MFPREATRRPYLPSKLHMPSNHTPYYQNHRTAFYINKAKCVSDTNSETRHGLLLHNGLATDRAAKPLPLTRLRRIGAGVAQAQVPARKQQRLRQVVHADAALVRAKPSLETLSFLSISFDVACELFLRG